MAPRRAAKKQNVVKDNNYNNLSLSDVLCPICRTILIEPVTLPCNHGFCSSCFDGTMANANLVCPLCRIRVGSWLRASKKENKLVNLNLWEAIKKYFPQQVKNKLEGVDENLEEEPIRITSQPGEIRREYEEQKAKEDEERRKCQEEETKASELLIQKLKEEEALENSIIEEKIRNDEQVAKKLAEELSFDPGPSTSKVETKHNKSLRKQGPLDTFLKNMTNKQLSVPVKSLLVNSSDDYRKKDFTTKVLCQDGKNLSVGQVRSQPENITVQRLNKVISERRSRDSSDTITSECRYFKPIEQKRVPPPKNIHMVRVPAIPATPATNVMGPPNGHIAFRHYSVLSPFVVLRVSPKQPEIPHADSESTFQDFESHDSNINSRNSDKKRKHSTESGECQSRDGNVQETPKKVRISSQLRQTRSMTKSVNNNIVTIPSRSHKKPEKRKSLLKDISKSPKKLSVNKNSTELPEYQKEYETDPNIDANSLSTKRLKDTLNRSMSSPFLGFERNYTERSSFKSRNGVRNLNTIFKTYYTSEEAEDLTKANRIMSSEVGNFTEKHTLNKNSHSEENTLRNGESDIHKNGKQLEDIEDRTNGMSLQNIELIVGAKCLRSDSIKKKFQEEEDLKLARKLHEELNSVRYSTRNSINHAEKRYPAPRRQITLYNFLEK